MVAEENEVIKSRIRWMGRLTAKSTLALSLFVGVAVYAARVPDQYVCLQLVNGNGGNIRQFDLVDLQSGNDLPDSRVGQSPLGVPSPDGHYAAIIQPDRPGSSTSSLLIQASGNSEGQMGPIVVQNGIAGTSSGFASGFGRFTGLRWSPDSNRLAYLWTDADQQAYLSVVNADGSGKMTVPFPDMGNLGNTNTPPNRQINWSADSAYLSIGETLGNAGARYTLWSSADLQRVDMGSQDAFRAASWSPQDHQFAAIQQTPSGVQSFTVWLSLDQEVWVPFDATPGRVLDQIMWSADGHYIALQSHRQCSALESCTQRLSYDILSSDGKLIISDIPGEASGSGNQNQNLYRSAPLYTTTTPVAAWSADGATLIFLQTNPVDNLENLIVLHLPARRYETIARDVVSDLAQEMLYNAFTFRRQPFSRAAGTPTGNRLILPTWHNGKIDIQLADLDGSNRTTLVQGADEVLDPRPTLTGYTSRFWISNGRMVAVLWATIGADKTRHVHLTWADPDGSNKHDIDDGWESISQLQLVQGKDQRWLGYVAQRDGQSSIELMDVDSGESHRILGGLTSAEQWALALAPVGNRAAIQLGVSASRLFGESTLFLVSLDGTWARQVSAQVTGPASWSPDGSKLAFLYHESANSELHAQAVNADGTSVQDVPILHANSSSPRLYRWSQCS